MFHISFHSEVKHEGHCIQRQSPQEGNTALLIGHIFEALNKEGIKTMRDLGENMPWLLKRIAE